MPSAHGVIQGYNGVASADSRHQVIVHAEAFGEGQEAGLLAPMLTATRDKLICPAGKELFVKNRNFRTHEGYHGTVYMSKKTDCRVCELRPKCLRSARSEVRQVAKFAGRGSRRGRPGGAGAGPGWTGFPPGRQRPAAGERAEDQGGDTHGDDLRS